MTSPAPNGGPSPLRVGGLALLGVGIVAGIIGLAALATDSGGDTEPTAAAPQPTTAAPAPPAPTPLPTLDPAPPDPALTAPGAVPPGSAPPGSVPPGSVPPGAEPPPGAPAPSGEGAVPLPSFGSTTPTNGIAAPPPPAASDGSGGSGTGGGSGGSGNSGGSGAGSGDGNRAATVRAPLRVYNNSTITGLASRAADDFRNAGWQVDEVANYPQGVIPTSTVYYEPGVGNQQQAAESLGREFNLRVSPRFEGLTSATPGLIVIVTNDYKAH